MNFTVYRSSAGSGKTYTLVREYLKIALSNPVGFRTILAVTFTNKAANEMKERIITNLKEIADYKNNQERATIKNMLPQLEKELQLTKAEIAQRADTVLRAILHNYSEFAISTIDSFMHKIIRTFAYDLHLAQNFDVELDTDELMSKVVDILISEVGNDEALTKTLVNFVQSKTDDDKSWHIETDLQNMAKRLTSEDAQLYVERLRKLTLDDFEKITKKTRALISSFEKMISALAKSAVEKIEAAGIPDAAFYNGKNGLGGYLRKIANKRMDKLFPGIRVIATIEEDKWYAAKCSLSERNSIDSIKGFLTDIYLKLQEEREANYKDYVLFNEIWKNLYPLAVLSELEKVLNDYKKSNNIIHISEFNKLIAGIVSDQPVPFIYERVGEKYRHFLIDEFQDTSVLQWHNILPLVENSLADSNFNMIVGDGKQAIYRWRGGEVEQFARLPEIFKKPDSVICRQREMALKRNYHPEVLKSNYRSKKEIVEFNNDFFTVVGSLIGDNLKSIYNDVTQEYNNDNDGGLVQIDFLRKDDDMEVTIADVNLNRTFEIVEELLDDGYGLKDIAVLCRKNDEANLIAAFLIENNYNVVSSESLLIKNSPDVQFLIDLIRYLNDGADNIAKAGVLHFLASKGRLRGTLHNNFSIVNVKEDDIEKNLFNQQETFADVLYGFGFKAKVLKKLPLYNMVEEIIRVFDMASKADVYVQFFLDAVLDFSLKDSSGISGFMEWWEKKKNGLSVVVPEGINAVRVMTIHKSKGLEFPVVIFPFAKSRVGKAKDKLWIDLSDKKIDLLDVALLNTGKTLENTDFQNLYTEEMDKSFLDLINLAYVVMTRPSERLYILTEIPPADKSKTDSLPKFFYYYLNVKERWNEDETVYTFGEKVEKKELEDNTDEQAFKMEEMISNRWRNKMLLSLKAPEYWDVTEPESATRYGNLIHLILSKIKTIDDLEIVLNRSEQEGIIEPDVRNEIEKKIRTFLSNNAVGGYFKQGMNVKTEAEILLPNGSTIRPDRLIIEENKATVIDFKTGKPSESHKRQVKMYKEKIRELGFDNVSGILLYVNEDEAVVVV